MKLRLSQKLVLCALLIAQTSACALVQRMGSSGGGKPIVLTSTDGGFQLTVPGDWRSETALNEQASIQASHRFRETYVVLLTESKRDFTGDMTLEQFTTMTRDAMMSQVRSAATTELKPMTINGNRALEYEITGGVEGLNIVYLITTVETPGHYHQIITWTLPSRLEQYRGTLREVTQSFREVGGAEQKANTPATVPPPVSTPSRAVPDASKR